MAKAKKKKDKSYIPKTPGQFVDNLLELYKWQGALLNALKKNIEDYYGKGK